MLMYAMTFLYPETLQSKKEIHPLIIFKHYAHAFSNRQLIVFSLETNPTTADVQILCDGIFHEAQKKKPLKPISIFAFFIQISEYNKSYFVISAILDNHPINFFQ